MTGADGIAELSRLVVRALNSLDARPGSALVDVLSLTDAPDARAFDHTGPEGRLYASGGRWPRFVAEAVRVRIAGQRPSHVVCLHAHLGPVAALLAGRRARLVTVLVGIEVWKPLRPLERWALARSDLLVAISAHTARRFDHANATCRGRRVEVCHLAVRNRPASGVAPPPEPSARPPFALIVGRMAAEERYKGHDLLIDLWPSVVQHVPGARLVVVGDGDDRARLERKAAGVSADVRFLGRVSDDTLATLYRDCAFFVMPSRDEGFGLVFLEAMRAAKPCIGGTGAASEVIDDGVTGFVVEPEREPVLRAVLRLFREPETCKRMGEAGAARVAREFTEPQFRARFRALLGLPEPDR